MKRRNPAGAFVAGAAVVLVAAPPVAAAPAPTFPPVDGGASVQTLTPSRPSTPALDDAFLSDLTRAGIRIAASISVTYTARSSSGPDPQSIELRIMRYRRFKELNVQRTGS
jgi:hypothetical protein